MFVKDSKDMGIQFNTSFVGNDKDGYTAGAHLVTSDGLDISNEIKGDCIDDAIQKLMTGIIKEAVLTKAEDKKKEPKEDAKNKRLAELKRELQDTEDQYRKVAAQIDKFDMKYRDIEKEIHKLENEESEEDSRLTLDDVLGFDGDFLDYIDSLLK